MIETSIDIGTNSTRLLVAEMFPDKKIIPITYLERITKLGGGLDENNRLDDEAMQRVIAALLEFMPIIASHQVRQTHLIATSATRDAVNRDEFLAKIKHAADLDCRVLSGDDEARLSFLGAISDTRPDGEFLVCDIGGGSTEFIFGEDERILYSESIDIGSRRLTQTLLVNDPPRQSEIRGLFDFVRERIDTRFAGMQVSQLLVAGGTASTLALIDANMPISHAERAHLYTLNERRLQAIIERLRLKSVKERRRIRGLHPERADVILTGAVILAAIMNRFEQQSATVTLRDLLFGILMD